MQLNSPSFMEAEGSLSCAQQPTHERSPEPVESYPHSHVPF